GKACSRCGWVYPNPHPSKKHRKAHRKHCGAAASKPRDDAGDVVVAVHANDAACELLADADPRKKSGAQFVAFAFLESKPERDGRELCKDAILETDTADKSSKSCALCHGNKVQSSDVEFTASQLDCLTHFQNHSVSCGVDMICTADDTKGSSYFPLTKGSSLDASKEEMGCATVQYAVESATVANDKNIGNHIENKLDADIPKALILPHDSSINFSSTDSELQDKEKYMEISVTVDQVNTVTTLMSGLPHEVSENTMEPEPINCIAQDRITDVAGQMCQVQLSSEGGRCTLEINAGEPFEISAHSSGCEYQFGKPANSLENENELEDLFISEVASTTLLVEASDMKPGSPEDCGLVGAALTTICANSQVGNELGERIINDVPKVVPSELLVVEFDKSVDNFLSTLPFNKEFSLHIEKLSAVENNGSIDDQDDMSQLVNIFECEFQCPEEETNWLGTHEQVSIAGSPVDQAMVLDSCVTSSCESFHSSSGIEAQKINYLSEGQDIYISYEGSLADSLGVSDSGLAVYGVIQSSIAFEVSYKNQNVSQETTEVNNCVVVEEKKHEMDKEESLYMDSKELSSCQDPKYDSQCKCYASELVPSLGDDIERMELQNHKDVISTTPEEISSSYTDSISNYYLDEPDPREATEGRFIQFAAGYETNDHPERQAEPCVIEAILENVFPGEHYDKLDLHKDEVDNVQTSGSQLKLKNLLVVRSVYPLSSDENNPDNPFVTDVQIPSVDKENSFANIHNEQPNPNELSEVGLCHDGEDHKTEECSTSEVDVQSIVGKPDSDSRTSDTSGVPSSSFYHSSKEEDIYVESMQCSELCTRKIDDSADSNGQRASTEASLVSVSDGAIPFLSYSAKGESNFDGKASPITDSQTTRDLQTSDPAAGALFKSDVDSSDMVEGPSLTILVEPGRRSEPKGRNGNEENAAKELNWNSGKPYVMLKNLLAEADTESEQKVPFGRGHNASLTCKRRNGLHDDGYSLKPATSKIVSDKSNEPFDNQVDHSEWNSPARLPVTQHVKKKVKGRQAWVPFICCASMN
ncbi:unnamed protein product, partial [Musa acuminata subsp. burmannicoides]